ncbi:MAG: hypothetical protein LBV75_08330 [Paludibacter sp.]|jgi:hypothetical protein|nr:hypothetical protein [Paludibacter sp.]
MKRKIYEIRSKILLVFIITLTSVTCIFLNSCKREKKIDKPVLCAVVYKLEIPPFSPPCGEAPMPERIKIVYVIISKRILDKNDIFVEKTGNIYDTLNINIIDDVTHSVAITNKLENKDLYNYRYECCSNKSLDIIYNNRDDFEQYYRECQKIIKNTELFYKSGNVYVKPTQVEDYKELLLTSIGKFNSNLNTHHKYQVYNFDE